MFFSLFPQLREDFFVLDVDIGLRIIEKTVGRCQSNDVSICLNAFFKTAKLSFI